jgi:hypothetical protein
LEWGDWLCNGNPRHHPRAATDPAHAVELFLSGRSARGPLSALARL